MSSSQTTDSPQVKFARELAQAFQTRDVGFLAKSIHKDYRRVSYPRSMGKPDRTGEEWVQDVTEKVGLWAGDSELTIHSIIEAPGKVVLHFSNKVETTLGMEFDSESMFILSLVTDEDGILKLKAVEGFADSQREFEFAKAVAEARASKKNVA